MAFNTSSRSVKEGVNKAKLKFEIPNFRDVVGKTRKGQVISSKQCDVGESKFALVIYPNGTQLAEKGMMSAYLLNESNHDVVVDFKISVERGNTVSGENEKIKKGEGLGRVNFMRAREVGTDLKMTVEVKLKWEDVSGGVVEQNQVKSKDLVQVEERLGGKLEQMGGKLEQMEQRMKTFVRGELAKVKATSIPECPVCFLQLKTPKKIVQCLKVGIYGINFCFPIILTKIYAKVYPDTVDCRCTKLILV